MYIQCRDRAIANRTGPTQLLQRRPCPRNGPQYGECGRVNAIGMRIVYVGELGVSLVSGDTTGM